MTTVAKLLALPSGAEVYPPGIQGKVKTAFNAEPTERGQQQDVVIESDCGEEIVVRLYDYPDMKGQKNRPVRIHAVEGKKGWRGCKTYKYTPKSGKNQGVEQVKLSCYEDAFVFLDGGDDVLDLEAPAPGTPGGPAPSGGLSGMAAGGKDHLDWWHLYAKELEVARKIHAEDEHEAGTAARMAMVAVSRGEKQPAPIVEKEADADIPF